jgi:hypothetical protein
MVRVSAARRYVKSALHAGMQEVINALSQEEVLAVSLLAFVACCCAWHPGCADTVLACPQAITNLVRVQASVGTGAAVREGKSL